MIKTESITKTDGYTLEDGTKGNHNEKRNVIPFANTFNHISTRDLEEVMEWLSDSGYLSERGKVFRSRFWDLFIKSKNEN